MVLDAFFKKAKTTATQIGAVCAVVVSPLYF